MSLHPFIDIRVGDEEITSVPPEFVLSMTYKSSIEALSTFDFEVIDPTFTAVEELLLLSDSQDRPIIFRFGYIDPSSGLVSSNWLQSRLIRYSPTLDSKGMRIIASCLVDVGLRIVNANTTAYSGKISTVVEKIAKELGIGYEVEETNDDINDADPNNRGNPKEWPTEGLPPLEFVKLKLLEIARSKSSTNNYVLYVTGTRDRTLKPTLHFHTIEYPLCDSRRKKTKEFNYLANQSEAVIEFKPEYNSTGLGNLGGSHIVMRAVDPITKQFVIDVQNTKTNPNYVGVGDGTKSNSKPIESGAGNEGRESQAGILMAQEVDRGVASDRARNVWTLLKAYSLTASLSLVGLPPTSDIEANDLIKMNVLIPGPTGDPNYPGYREHWSSGVYLITEAVHQIGAQYTVDCQLRRDYSSVGSAPALPSKLIVPEISPVI